MKDTVSTTKTSIQFQRLYLYAVDYTAKEKVMLQNNCCERP